MSVSPISPDEALSQKYIPDPILLAVNDLLKERAGQSVITITQAEVVASYLVRVGSANGSSPDRRTLEQEVHDRRWLDFEQKYRDVGWEVQRYVPDYTETHNPYWTFRRAKKS